METGPSHYTARRAQWLTGAKEKVEEKKTTVSPSRMRLEQLLSKPDAAEDDEAWTGGVETVWRGLNAGRSLKQRLPLGLMVRIKWTEMNAVDVYYRSK